MRPEQRRQAAEGSVAVVYDGFMSYSHSADDLLAPRLQAALQRFAKPWWKRRALRIFRDEASLSANPHLWSSITEALDQSAWFVLLLSPEAAQSQWVNQEVEYWLSHKDASRIVPVVTDGDFGWAARDISPGTDSAPLSLCGAFAEEPRWVDLRWARTDEQLDLNNARFRNGVADIASALRGVPKDELESEEVKQHRRNIRTAWTAGIALLLLLVLATATAVYAMGQSNEADRQRDIAQQNEREANENQALAQQEAERANVEADRANSEAARATAETNRATAEADRANETARQVLELARPMLNASNTLLTVKNADAGVEPAPLGEVQTVPANDRLWFFNDRCIRGTGTRLQCFIEGVFLHPEGRLAAFDWLAHRPFHIRRGFINTEDAPLGEGFDLVVLVTRTRGPELGEGVFELGQPYRFNSDYVLRQESAHCGPSQATQLEPQPCEWFVHDFPDGLPPGQFNIRVEWHAPCSAWIVGPACTDRNEVFSLFSSSSAIPFFADDYTPQDNGVSRAGRPQPWPYEAWDHAFLLPSD